MSVPPPSCTFMSVSTGSVRWVLRSITSVSKATNCSFTAGRPHRHAAVTAAWITEPTMLPDWSTATMICHCSPWRRCRLQNNGRSITSWRRAGTQWPRLDRIVPRGSKLRIARCAERRRCRAPAKVERTWVARASTSRATTLRTNSRARSSTSALIRCLVKSTARRSVSDGSIRASTSRLVTTSWRPNSSTASRSRRSIVSRGNNVWIWLIHSGTVRADGDRSAPRSSRSPSAASRP
jgi:hypothetical protein